MAINNLGVMHITGQGTKTDPIQARRCFKRAYKLGNIKATTNLAQIYHLGLGVEQNIEKSVFYYKIASKKGFFYYFISIFFFLC